MKKSIIITISLAFVFVFIFASAVKASNISSYKLESKHFYWNADTELLKNNISPENFALWLSRLDTVYETYTNLVGKTPANGEKIEISLEYDENNYIGWAWAYVGSNKIGWASAYVADEMRSIDKKGDWSFGIMHEIGHLFDDGTKWDFHSEFTANLKLLYAMETTSAKTVHDENLQSGTYYRKLWYKNALKSYNEGNLESAISESNDNLMFYFSPIIDNVGWKVFESAFRSYFDNSYLNQEKNIYSGPEDAVKLANLLDRLTYFNNGKNVLEYSLDKGETLRKMYPVTKTPRTSIDHSQYRDSSYRSFFVPEFINKIDDWAFLDSKNLESVVIPPSVTTIGVGAFYGCTALKNFYIYSRNASISDSAFLNESGGILDNITVYGYSGSTAENYARRNNIKFVALAEQSSDMVYVSIDGKNVAFESYNINGNNYFKLRDIAFALNNSKKQFEIEWNAKQQAIFMTSSKLYTIAGGEITKKRGGTVNPIRTTAKVYLDGRELNLTAYNILGNNYFKLRDVGQEVDFGIVWNEAARTILIDTNSRYQN